MIIHLNYLHSSLHLDHSFLQLSSPLSTQVTRQLQQGNSDGRLPDSVNNPAGQQEDRQVREDVTSVDPGRETQSRQTSCRWLSHQAGGPGSGNQTRHKVAAKEASHEKAQGSDQAQERPLRSI